MSARPALNVAELGFEFEANPLTRWFGHSTFSTFEMVKVRMMVLTWVIMMMLRNLKMNQRLLGKNQPLRNLLLFQHYPKMLKGNCQRRSLRKRKWQS
ncbi:uncharacterized protein LOC121975068 isoform X3 [Zingiber officinale]|uniref:uncharacterized protein LOC121975068 isoform X3 n=1 Tax=Zingiber officinale TaxID=94328 RepID=UPI001C4B7536|nr:uncharacterized protein LOC121975068 isoform X3 [Zingiber officinale]